MSKNNAKKETPGLSLRIERKLLSRGYAQREGVDAHSLYHASVQAIKDIMRENRHRFKKRVAAMEGKRVYYLCMEFLLGRSLRNHVMNLGLYDELCQTLSTYGYSFDEIFSEEIDPGLGNGGLGRLAACFMDSLTALEYPAVGYSLCYENGLFKQKIVEGEQVELPDAWRSLGGAWLSPRPDRSVSVRFGGQIEECWEGGALRITHTEYDEVRAIPYDVMISAPDTDATNLLRLWRAGGVKRPGEGYATQSEYLMALSESEKAEEITKQLYPPDNHDEGKLLRLTQQYFLVSASLQSLMGDYLSENGSLRGFSEGVAIHINDTHPALCIPELMRILMDVYSYSWEAAWEIVTKTVSYTNHTVLPEALECWRVDLFRMKLPRLFAIVEQINSRFCTDLWNLYPGDWDRISRMAIVANGQVRMANLSVCGSHTVNGVSALHSEILKKSVFSDFYHATPWKFTSVTNGVVHRRWLCYANPLLCSLLDDTIGPHYRRDPLRLSELSAYADDGEVVSRLQKIKRANKERFSAFMVARGGEALCADSIFDVQIKRMHEYKRQLLNVLRILSLYDELCQDPNADVYPTTFIFGAKAAPGYYMAKQLIRLIWFLSREIRENKRAKGRLSVVFAEDYNVSVAESLIPAADISEQISLAGKEASGTGCMKLMMNGALTLGTLDGANPEIKEAVGDENFYAFGLNATEVEELWRIGYDASEYYRRSPRLQNAIARLEGRIGGESFSHIAEYLLGRGNILGDPYMCLADFDSYRHVSERAFADYKRGEEWGRRSLLNIAASGRFSADISVRQYAEGIWHLRPIKR